MKSLKEYCKFDRIKDLYIEDIKEYFDNNIPDYLYNKLNTNNYITDYILENLKSHNTKQLQDKISDKFSGKYSDIEFQKLTDTKEDYKVKGFLIYSENNIDNLYNDKEFKNLILFYGYYITDKTDTHLVIVPTYPENVSEYVYKENKGILYHFTSNKYADEILNTGLRIKKSRYREYPERIYLYSCGYKKIKDIPDINDFINSVVNPYNIKRYGLSVYKVNLNKIEESNIEFYTDEYMNNKEAVFIYNNIPKECITKINI